ncbi:MAG TPA: hypothetical protein VHA75_06510 [Rugosimonospora sp.]|nr:hypothetical protein [Rugosimonospora sp.]
MNSQRKQTRPAVIFVDHAIWWGTFAQLAAVVRRRGARAVRVTTARGTWYNRLVDRLLFSRAIYLDGSADLGNVARLVADENVIDMQCTEYVCGFLAHGDAAALPAPIGPSLVTRGLLLDKFTVGELGTARGVRTPPKLAADKVSVAEAVAAMGLPLVVKARVGASGDLVRIARTAEDVERAVAEMSPNPADLFFEQMITGKDVDYSVIVGPEGVVLDVVTRTVAAPPGSTTPPTQIEIVDAPDLVELGRLAVEKLGFTGIAHMDTVEDAEGRHSPALVTGSYHRGSLSRTPPSARRTPRPTHCSA